VIVSSTRSLMPTCGDVLIPPGGYSAVAVEVDGPAFATCTDPHTWFEFEPTGTHQAHVVIHVTPMRRTNDTPGLVDAA